MIDYSLIDAHIHLWRDAGEQRAQYGRHNVPESWLWGCPGIIPRYLEARSLSHVVFLNIIDAAGRIRRALAERGLSSDTPAYTGARDGLRDDMKATISDFNAWACAVHRDNPALVPCVYADPVLFGVAGCIDEVTSRVRAGAHGVKMHPEVSLFLPSDASVWPLYEAIQDLAVPIVFDTGASADGTDPARPVNFAEMLQRFPRLVVVMAHLGSVYWDERVQLAARFPNLVFDTAGGFTSQTHLGRGGVRALSEEDATRIIRTVGVDRVMFGTDSPGLEPMWQMFQMARLPFSESERRLVFADNARRIFRL